MFIVTRRDLLQREKGLCDVSAKTAIIVHTASRYQCDSEVWLM